MTTVLEASAHIMAGAAPLPAEPVSLRDALGRVLAEDVRSPVALPPWDNSGMDGYAVRAADIAGASAESPVVLPVVESVAAGRAPTQPLRAGTAIRVMTGAPVPEGCDSVVRVEDTDGGTERVAIRDARDAGRNIRARGEDLALDAVAVRAGDTLTAARIGVLASVGCASVPAHRRPRVGILGTGDELVDVGYFHEVLAGRRIVSSNSYSLYAAVLEAGGIPEDLGFVRDDAGELRGALERGAAARCDLLLTSGGVSVGAHDLTRQVVESLGAPIALWRVRMRPGAPLAFGSVQGIPWIGLPGNPVSALVTFELFGRPFVKALRGSRLPFRSAVDVVLGEDVRLGAQLTHFMRAVVKAEGSQRVARLTGPQGSGLLTSMARANALLVLGPDRLEFRAGEPARALLLEGGESGAAKLAL